MAAFVMRRRRIHLLTAAACLAALVLALIAQHVFDKQPCPWCILQRVIFLAMAAVSLLTAWMPAVISRAGHAVVALLGAGGVAAAVFQNQVAAKTASCDLSLADRWLSQWGLDRLLPEVFEVRAGCADAAVSILGVPFELWSAALFGMLAALAIAGALQRR